MNSRSPLCVTHRGFLYFQDYFPKNLGKYLLVSENNTTFAHRNTDESDTGRAGLVSGDLRYTAVTDLC